MSLLPLLYVYFVAKAFSFDLRSLAITAAGICSVLAFMEIVAARAARRRARWPIVRWLLTACGVLSLAPMMPMFFHVLSSLAAAPTVAVYVAVVAGPSSCLAAAAWVAVRGVEQEAVSE